MGNNLYFCRYFIYCSLTSCKFETFNFCGCLLCCQFVELNAYSYCLANIHPHGSNVIEQLKKCANTKHSYFDVQLIESDLLNTSLSRLAFSSELIRLQFFLTHHHHFRSLPSSKSFFHAQLHIHSITCQAHKTSNNQLFVFLSIFCIRNIFASICNSLPSFSAKLNLMRKFDYRVWIINLLLWYLVIFQIHRKLYAQDIYVACRTSIFLSGHKI